MNQKTYQKAAPLWALVTSLEGWEEERTAGPKLESPDELCDLEQGPVLLCASVLPPMMRGHTIPQKGLLVF